MLLSMSNPSHRAVFDLLNRIYPTFSNKPYIFLTKGLAEGLISAPTYASLAWETKLSLWNQWMKFEQPRWYVDQKDGPLRLLKVETLEWHRGE